MKKTLIFFFLIGAAMKCRAVGVPTTESPILGFGTPTTISISTDTLLTSAWTKIPSSQTSGRFGIFIDVPNTNTGKLVGHYGNCNSTAIATSVRPIEISPSSNTTYLSMREDVCLWAITTHTAAENVHYQEVKQ